MTTELSAVSDQPSATAAQSSRIAAKFAECKANGRAAFIPYLTAGYPSLEHSVGLIEAIVAGGADLIEIGVPFSDPLADGTTIQAASQKALDAGVTLQDCFDLVVTVRARGVEIPLLFMGYTNPFYQYGLDRLAQTAAEVGVDGFIIPDLPSDESEEFAAPLRAHGRDLIFLLAPTSTDTRIQDAAERASGFMYCVSLTGVTGARNQLSEGLPAYIARVRARTDLPLAIGFGISKPEHVAQAAAIGDGVIVGAALINQIDSLSDAELYAGTTAFVRSLVDATGTSS